MADQQQLYEQANHYLNEGLIRRQWPEEPSPRKRREWMEWWLPQLGQPQQGWDAIHVAGTSGKGSVASIIAEVLRASGVRAGLHVSPYLQSATEKLWVDGRYASAEQYADLVRWIRPACEAARGPHTPLHGMASVGVCLEHFRREAVQLGVVEAGVGGRSDLTNVLNTQVAVITSLGLDHVKTLGPTLEQIAWHKAGVIKAGCRAVVLDSCPEAVAAAQQQADDVGAPMRVLSRRDFRGEAGPDGAVRLWFRGERLSIEGAPLAMPGLFQAENAALALAAVEELGQRGHPVTEEAARLGLSRARIPGRLELVPPGARNHCPVLLDGAHNPDKLGAMLSVLPALGHRRLHVVYGSLGHRTPDQALRRLASQAATFVAAEPRVYGKAPRPVDDVLTAVADHAAGEVLAEAAPMAALQAALDRAHAEDLVLVTGSLYLCGEARGRWYPEPEVVARGQSWW